MPCDVGGFAQICQAMPSCASRLQVPPDLSDLTVIQAAKAGAHKSFMGLIEPEPRPDLAQNGIGTWPGSGTRVRDRVRGPPQTVWPKERGRERERASPGPYKGPIWGPIGCIPPLSHAHIGGWWDEANREIVSFRVVCACARRLSSENGASGSVWAFPFPLFCRAGFPSP